MLFNEFLTFIFFILAGWVICSIVYWSYKNGISPMPTSPKVKLTVFEALPPHVSGPIFELGSGWGTLAFPLAVRYPDQSVEAYETSSIPYYFSQARLNLSHCPNLHLHKQDFFEISLKDASLVICYLYPKAMERLKIKFEQELPFDSLIITNTFCVPGWNPIEIIETQDLYRTKVYVYRKGGA